MQPIVVNRDVLQNSFNYELMRDCLNASEEAYLGAGNSLFDRMMRETALQNAGHRMDISPLMGRVAILGAHSDDRDRGIEGGVREIDEPRISNPQEELPQLPGSDAVTSAASAPSQFDEINQVFRVSVEAADQQPSCGTTSSATINKKKPPSKGVLARIGQFILSMFRAILLFLTFNWLFNFFGEAQAALKNLKTAQELYKGARPSQHQWSPYSVWAQEGQGLRHVDIQWIDNQGEGNCLFHSIAICVQEVLSRQPDRIVPLQEELRGLIATARAHIAVTRMDLSLSEAAKNIITTRLEAIIGPLEGSIDSIERGERLSQEAMRSWVAFTVLYGNVEDQALLGTVFEMAPEVPNHVDGAARWAAMLEIVRCGVQGTDNMLHLVSNGALQGTMGLIAVRDVIQYDGCNTLERRSDREGVVTQGFVMMTNENQDPEVFLVHVGGHFLSARLPLPVAVVE